jgi:hypothetical protein
LIEHDRWPGLSLNVCIEEYLWEYKDCETYLIFFVELKSKFLQSHTKVLTGKIILLWVNISSKIYVVSVNLF